MNENQPDNTHTTLKIGDRYCQGDWIWEVYEVAEGRVKARRAGRVITVEQKIEDILPHLEIRPMANDTTAEITVGRLMEILSQCPRDRPIYILDDSMEYPVSVVMPEFPWRNGAVVMLSAGNGWSGVRSLS